MTNNTSIYFHHSNNKLSDCSQLAKKKQCVGSHHILSIIKLTHKQNGPMEEIKILEKKGSRYHYRHKENYFLDTIIGRKFGVSFVDL